MRKLLLAFCAISALGVFEAATSPAEAVVYCRYINYPSNCVVRPGVVLVPRPVARAVTPGLAAPGVGIRRGTPINRGGPVNRVGRR
ncbi:MAG: hypothetical protein K2X45_15860 [Phreatobacter sp.]|nr:hypothetical protein [Phreatobacter sp.]